MNVNENETPMVDRPTPADPDWDGERCRRCGRAYAVVWAAVDDLWNEVVGSSAGMLCPDCFDDECNIRGIFPFFVAFREHVNIRTLIATSAAGLASTEPSSPA